MSVATLFIPAKKPAQLFINKRTSEQTVVSSGTTTQYTEETSAMCNDVDESHRYHAK